MPAGKLVNLSAARRAFATLRIAGVNNREDDNLALAKKHVLNMPLVF
jgi:hypothetical protein